MGRYAELQKAWDENREEFRRLKEEMEKNEDAFLKIDQEMEAMEQEPIKDSDVVVMFSSQFETDYVVCKITDQSREWVKEQMNNIAGMDEDALANLDVEEYFRDQGAEVMSILASNGKGDDYPVFYDFWFDVDEAEVVESTELSIEKQVENLINRIDFGEPVLIRNGNYSTLMRRKLEIWQIPISWHRSFGIRFIIQIFVFMNR